MRTSERPAAQRRDLPGARPPRASTASRGRLRTALALGLGAGALVYLLAWAAYGALLALGLARSGWPALLRELTLYLFVPLPVLLLAALLVRARAALLFAAPVLLVFLLAYRGRLLPRPPPAAAEAGLTLLTFNAGGNAGGGRAAPLLRTIHAVDADVVALQEVPELTRPALRQELAAAYPYTASFADTDDMLVLSRYPLRDSVGLPLIRGAFRGHQVTVAVGGRAVRLVNIHLSRPSYRLRWRGGLVPTVRAYDPLGRDVQIAELLDYVRTLDGPRLLVGDFNAGEWSRSHALLTADLGDSFAEAGSGFGHTYPSNVVWGDWDVSLPLLRIDYVFHSRELVARHAAVGPDGGSDHLPVVAWLAFR